MNPAQPVGSIKINRLTTAYYYELSINNTPLIVTVDGDGDIVRIIILINNNWTDVDYSDWDLNLIWNAINDFELCHISDEYDDDRPDPDDIPW